MIASPNDLGATTITVRSFPECKEIDFTYMVASSISRSPYDTTGLSIPWRAIELRKRKALIQLSHTISIVDDSDIVRRTFRALLKHAGYSVTEYASGREFLDQGLAEQDDCILLDLEMPGLNGIEVLGALQDLDCKTPVIVITGTNDKALLAAADHDIVAAVLKKPVGPDALCTAVAGALCSTSHND